MNLRQVIATTYAYYNRGQTIDEAVLEMYIDDLNDLDPAACISGYAKYRRNPANRMFPLPAQIRELVNPGEFISAEIQAREIAARIVGAIAQFGWNNGTQARLYIGPVGWSAVERSGGWMHLCQNTGVTIQPTTLQAQLRDQIEGNIKHGVRAVESAILALPDEGSERLRTILRLADKKPDGPDGAA